MFIEPAPDRRRPGCKVCPTVDEWGYTPDHVSEWDHYFGAWGALASSWHDRFCEDYFSVHIEVVTVWYDHESWDDERAPTRQIWPASTESISLSPPDHGPGLVVERLGWVGPEATQLVGSGVLVDY